MINKLYYEEFYIKMAKQFKEYFNMSIKQIMILEAVCFKLQDISTDKDIDEVLLYSKYGFKYSNTFVLNMFVREYNLGDCINPIDYYGLDNIKNSNILKLVLRVIDNSKIENRNQIEEIATKVISIIQEEVCTAKKGEIQNIVKNHYCKMDLLADNTISKENQKNILLYLLKSDINKDNNINIYDYDYMETFFLIRYCRNMEVLRQNVCKLLNWDGRDDRFDSKVSWQNKDSKLQLKAALYTLYALMYASKEYKNMIHLEEELYKKGWGYEELFRSQIVANLKDRETFFEALNMIIQYPYESTFKKVLQLL